MLVFPEKEKEVILEDLLKGEEKAIDQWAGAVIIEGLKKEEVIGEREKIEGPGLQAVGTEEKEVLVILEAEEKVGKDLVKAEEKEDLVTAVVEEKEVLLVKIELLKETEIETVLVKLEDIK